jgi:hypothetical protein
VELDEAFHLSQMTVTALPDGLELLCGVFNDFETIHGHEHFG